MSKRRGGSTRSGKKGGEFSSDEEVIRQSPRLRKQQTTKTTSQTTYMADVARLSDEELVEELRRYGEDPGPIVETTRGLYQKKLARLMGEKAKASSDSRSGEGVDYGTDKLGEWSSHSSEGETDPEGEGEGEEEEEEAGALPEPSASVRQRSSTTKSQQVVYHSYSTPTRHVESSYLLRKPKATPSKTPADEGAQQSTRKGRSSKPHPPHGAPPPVKAPPQSKPQPQSSVWSSLLSFALLLIMFSVTFLVYDHYTNPESSFFIQTVHHLQQLDILKRKDEEQ